MSHKPPFFIVGNYRSGTTLLRLMLTSHPKIFVPPETGFIVLTYWLYGKRRLFNSDYKGLVRELVRTDNWQDMKIDHKEIEGVMHSHSPESFREAMNLIYFYYGEKYFPEAERWGDKTTWYVDHVPLLARLFPEGQFIHLIRDGRDVACSYLDVPHKTHLIPEIAKQWVTNVDTIQKSAEKYLNKHRYLEVFYEDLVNKPETELSRICQFLGEQYLDDMLRFWQFNQSQTLEPERHLGWKRRTLQPVSSETVGKWQQRLGPIQVQNFEKFAGRMLLKLGYSASQKSNFYHLIRGELGIFLYKIYWRTRQRLRPWKARCKKGVLRSGVNLIPSK